MISARNRGRPSGRRPLLNVKKRYISAQFCRILRTWGGGWYDMAEQEKDPYLRFGRKSGADQEVDGALPPPPHTRPPRPMFLADAIGDISAIRASPLRHHIAYMGPLSPRHFRPRP